MMTNSIDAAPYHDRRTRPIGVHEISGWQFKVYGIEAPGRNLNSRTVEAAVQFVSDHLNFPDPSNSGYGFITVHAGEEAVWLLVDLWVTDILRHFLWAAPSETPENFAAGPADGTTACVWELAVVVHERDAWIKHALARPDDPDFASYLRDVLEITE